MKVEMVVKTEVEIDLDLMARVFCNLSDDEQSKFFVKVAEVAKKEWTGTPDSQWYYIGSHLRTCECSTEDARDMIRSIAWAIEHGTHS